MNTNVIVSFLVVFACFLTYEASATALPADMCRFPVERGNCEAFFERYAYDSEKHECVKFVYGGCHGNANNFLTKEECEHFCVLPKL